MNSAAAQDIDNHDIIINIAPYVGNVLSNISSITNTGAGALWTGDVSNDDNVTNQSGALWVGDITWNNNAIFNRTGSTWQGDILTNGGNNSLTQIENRGTWVGAVRGNTTRVYNEAIWTGDIIGNTGNIYNNYAATDSAVWTGDVLNNSFLILNFAGGTWRGNVTGNPGDIANYGDWIGNLNNRGRIIHTGVWTGDVVNTGTFFRAENQIIGAFDNRGSLQLTGNLSGITTLTNSGVLELNQNSALQTLSVGSLVLASGSSYQLDVTALGGSDRIAVSGAASLGGTVRVVTSTTGGGTFDEQKSYTILTAASISGSFASVSTDLAFLSPHLSYDTNNVYLGLRRNDVGFAATGATGNQIGVGASVGALGASNPIYDAVLWLTPEQAQAAFDQLSGEAYDSVGSTAIQSAGLIQGVMQSRIDQAFGALGDSGEAVSGYAGDMMPISDAHGDRGLWGQLYGAAANSTGGAKPLNSLTGGLVAGTDGMLGDWRLGAMIQLGATASSVPSLNSTVSSTDYGAGVYASTQWSATQLSLGGVYTLQDTKSVRNVAFPGFSDTLTASYLAGTAQAFAELSHEFNLGAVSLTPYAGFAQVRYATAGFTETGGSAALSRASQVIDATFATLGVGIDRSFVVGEDMLLTARASLGWRHAFTSNPSSVNSLAGSPVFAVAGAAVVSDVAVISAGLTLDVNATTNLDLAYDGQFGNGTQTHALKATWAMQF